MTPRTLERGEVELVCRVSDRAGAFWIRVDPGLDHAKILIALHGIAKRVKCERVDNRLQTLTYKQGAYEDFQAILRHLRRNRKAWRVTKISCQENF